MDVNWIVWVVLFVIWAIAFCVVSAGDADD